MGEPAIIDLKYIDCRNIEAIPLDLLESIKERGLMNPIYVARKGERFEVFEGKQRFHCVKQLGKAEIACMVFDKVPDLSPARHVETTPEQYLQAVKKVLAQMSLAELCSKVGLSAEKLAKRCNITVAELKSYENRS